MKILRKILLLVAGTLTLILVLILLFFRQEAYQLYKVLTFFNKEVISENFRSTDKIFPTTTVPKADVSYRCVSAAEPITLPESFQLEDSVIYTQPYLDYTLTDALLIIRHDTILHEYYANGFGPEDHHISWSMSKSVISALIGIAISEGKIKSIEEKVTDYLPDFAGTG
jgi:hypothetical protein